MKHLNKDQEKERENFVDPESNTELEIVEKISLLEFVRPAFLILVCGKV